MALAPDQDALNAVFHGDIQLIDSKFNTNVITQDISGRIVHMLQSKSWNGLHGLNQDRFYWKMFLRSAWGENLTGDDIVDIFNDIAASQKPSVSYSYSVRHVIRGFCNMIRHRIIPTKPIKYIIMHVYYRLKQILARA